jgi:hypothetical protein
MIPSFIELLDDGNENIRRKTTELVGKLVNHGEGQLKTRCDTTNPGYEGEFREAISRIIPSFIELLGDGNENIRRKTAELVGKLANYGKFQLKTRCGAADPGYKAEFRKTIAIAIPSFMQCLEDEYWGIRWKLVGVIGDLANHGEQSLKTIAA